MKDEVSQLTTENKKFASRNKQLIYLVLYLLVKQKCASKKVRELNDEISLHQTNVAFFMLKWLLLGQNLASKTDQLDRLKDEHKRLTLTVSSLEAKVLSLTTDNETLQTGKNQADRYKSMYLDHVRSTDIKMKTKNHEIDELNSTIKELYSTLTDMEAKKNEQTTELEEIKTMVESGTLLEMKLKFNIVSEESLTPADVVSYADETSKKYLEYKVKTVRLIFSFLMAMKVTRLNIWNWKCYGDQI